MRRIAGPLSPVLALVVAGCTIEQKVSVYPMRTRTVETTASKDETFTAALEGVLASGMTLGGSDRTVGVIHTAWRDTVQDDGMLPVCGGFAVDSRRSRRVMFTIAVEERRFVITPKPELCRGRVCGPVSTISGPELSMLNGLEASITAALAGRAPVAVEPGMTVLIGAEHEIQTSEIKSVKVYVP